MSPPREEWSDIRRKWKSEWEQARDETSLGFLHVSRHNSEWIAKYFQDDPDTLEEFLQWSNDQEVYNSPHRIDQNNILSAEEYILHWKSVCWDSPLEGAMFCQQMTDLLTDQYDVEPVRLREIGEYTYYLKPLECSFAISGCPEGVVIDSPLYSIPDDLYFEDPYDQAVLSDLGLYLHSKDRSKMSTKAIVDSVSSYSVPQKSSTYDITLNEPPSRDIFGPLDQFRPDTCPIKKLEDPSRSYYNPYPNTCSNILELRCMDENGEHLMNGFPLGALVYDWTDSPLAEKAETPFYVFVEVKPGGHSIWITALVCKEELVPFEFEPHSEVGERDWGGYLCEGEGSCWAPPMRDSTSLRGFESYPRFTALKLMEADQLGVTYLEKSFQQPSNTISDRIEPRWLPKSPVDKIIADATPDT